MQKELIESGKLTPAEINEIRHVFNIIDIDGSGELNPREIADTVTRLTGSQVSEFEIFKIWHTVDENKDTLVSWEEFLTGKFKSELAISKWLISTESTSYQQQTQIVETGGISDNQRKIFHQNIRNFFLQFQDIKEREISNISAIEQQFLEAQRAQDVGELFGYDGEGPLEEVGNQKRIEKIKQNELLLQNFPNVSAAINSSFKQEVEKGLFQLCGMFEIMAVFHSPSQRYQIANHLARLFDLTISSGILQRVVTFLDQDVPDHIQWTLLLIITYFAPGPGVPHTPKDSQFHPQKKTTKELLIKLEVLPKILRLVNSKCEEVREQAIVAIGFIARHDSDVRNLMRHQGVVSSLLDRAKNFDQSQITIKLLRKLTWTFSILAGASLPPPVLPLSHIELAKFLASILFTEWGEDKIVLANSISCLRFLLPEIIIEEGSHYTWLKVLSTIAHEDSTVRRVGIRALSYLLHHINQEQAIFLVQNKMLEGLELLITQPDEYNRKLALSCVGSLIERGMARDILLSSVPSRLVPLLYEDSSNRLQILKILNKLTNSDGSSLLLDLGLVRGLFYCLSCFRNYDHLLSDMYGFLGATYDFELLNQTLHLIFEYATLAKDLRLSALKSKFTQDLLERLQGAIKLIFTNPRQVAFDIKYYKLAKDVSVFQNIEATIKALGEMYARHQDKDESCRHNVARLQSLVADFRERLPSFIEEIETMGHRDFQNMIVKCFEQFNYPDGDNRFIEVRTDVSLLELFFQIQHRYSTQNLKLIYLDKQKDKITVDSEEVWHLVVNQSIREAQTDKREVLEVRLIIGKEGHKRNLSWQKKKRTSLFGMYQEDGYKQGAFSAPRSLEVDIHGRNWQSMGNKQKLMKNLTRELDITQKELERLYDSFKSVTKKRVFQNQEKGYVTKPEFTEIMENSQFDTRSCEHLFNAFDKEDKGIIDFRDFAAGYATMKRGRLEERLRFAFLAFDLDHSGFIDRQQFLEMMRSINDLKGSLYDNHTLKSMSGELFTLYDTNKDNKLSFAEFKYACKKEQLLLDTFWEIGF